ncbi:YphA family membrane protein [Alteribacter natronophilus]|uniref:YphA family membrane protein n=1 Tax=Alteribacter natronophilus TaxID=2583810 RepID=UPI00110F626D|nr:hypothetical protein [Alteribacter natronophilus]TMW73614.1 hypothetical protein FGB90_04760 [Alteribacter natronophilus]
MEGFWFLWAAWLSFIFAAFFISRHGFIVMSVILGAITGSFFTVSVSGVDLNGGLLLLAGAGYVIVARSGGTAGALLLSVAVSVIFGWLEYVYFYEPVWMFLPFEYVLAGAVTLLLIFLGRNFHLRTAVLFTGIFQGGIAFSLFVNILNDGRGAGLTTGGLSQLDILAFSFLALSAWSGLEYTAASLKSILLTKHPLPRVAGKKANA